MACPPNKVPPPNRTGLRLPHVRHATRWARGFPSRSSKVLGFYFWACIYISMNWLKGTFAGNLGFHPQNHHFPDFPLKPIPLIETGPERAVVYFVCHLSFFLNPICSGKRPSLPQNQRQHVPSPRTASCLFGHLGWRGPFLTSWRGCGPHVPGRGRQEAAPGRRAALAAAARGAGVAALFASGVVDAS